MIGELASPESADLDRYRCLNCGVAMEFYGIASTHEESDE
jgi:hypothetical protein